MFIVTPLGVYPTPLDVFPGTFSDVILPIILSPTGWVSLVLVPRLKWPPCEMMSRVIRLIKTYRTCLLYKLCIASNNAIQLALLLLVAVHSVTM